MPQVVEEVFLRYQDTRSNKGFVSRLTDNQDGTWSHFTAWGAVGRTFQQKDTPGLAEAKARAAHHKKVQEKMTGDTPYQPCEPEVLGFTASAGQSVAPQAVAAVQQERIWGAMLYTALGRTDAERVIASPEYFAQQKADGNRMRFYALEDGVIRACNRKGQALPVPQVLERLGRTCFERLRAFDFDGESLGNDRYVIFDELQMGLQVPAWHRVQYLHTLTHALPPGIEIVPTALTPDEKQTLLARAIAEGWEGLVLKRRDAPYHAGRSSQDYKYKLWCTANVLLTEVNAGPKSTYGSAAMAVLTQDAYRIPIGNVASGFKNGELHAVAERMGRGEHVIAEIRYLYFAEQALYQPCFRRIRTDLALADLHGEQLYGREGRLVKL